MANENHADFTPTIPDSKITPEKAPYVPVGSFKFWAQKVLPTVYDDSLSYYEVLTKLVWHINKMIEDMDNFNQTIDNTLNAFNETQEYINNVKNSMIAIYNQLQDYVNHYFDNLDVQNEINSKLDEMAESGELASIINPYVYEYISSITGNLVTEWLNKNVDPVGSAVTVDTSLSINGSAGDSKTIGDFFRSINSSTGLELNSGELWEVGGINTTTGANVETPGRVRTKKYVPTNTKLIKIPSTRGFFILAYRIGDIYVGAYKSTGEFVTNGSESGYTSFDLEPLQRLYPMYRFRLAVYSRASDNISLSETINWSITNSLYSVITAESNNLSKTTNINSSNLWEDGSINTSTGMNTTNGSLERIRTKNYLPQNAENIDINSNRGFFILAYSFDGAYVGAYASSGIFVQNGTESGYDHFDIGSLMRTYPLYRFKLVVFPRDGVNVSVNESSNWLITNNFFFTPTLTDTNTSNAHNINNPNLWEVGAIGTGNGANVQNTERVRTKWFLPSNSSYIKIDSTRGFYVLAYDIEGNYVGAYKTDNTFVKDGTESGYDALDIGELMSNFPTYRFKLSVYARTNPPIALSECENWLITNSLFNYLDNTTNVSNGKNINTGKLWSKGAINTTNGKNAYNNERVRTNKFIPTNADIIQIDPTRGFYILAYNLDGSYVGAYKRDGTFVVDGSETGYNTQFDIGSLQEKYPNYRFRLSVYARSNPPVNISECANWTFTNSIVNTDTIDLCVGEYNIGKFNMGNTGGLSSDVETKIQNYKKFFARVNADAFMLLECTENIDSNNTYNANSVLFDPIYLYRSHYERETEIVSQHNLHNTSFSYIHTSGDPSAWCIYGYTIIKNRRIALASAVLNVTANTEQKIRALDKLLNILLNGYDYAVIGMDTNALSSTEANSIKDYMNTHNYVSGNWSYLGYMNTYNLSSANYRSIDNIFVKGGKIVNFEVPDVYADLSSDHYPVVAKIRLN